MYENMSNFEQVLVKGARCVSRGGSKALRKMEPVAAIPLFPSAKLQFDGAHHRQSSFHYLQNSGNLGWKPRGWKLVEQGADV